MALPIFLFYSPLLIITERRLQSLLSGISPDLTHDKGKFMEIHRTDPFQIIYAAIFFVPSCAIFALMIRFSSSETKKSI